MIRTYHQSKNLVKSIMERVLKELKNNEKSMRINFGMHPLQ